jgi:hypothetical protein
MNRQRFLNSEFHFKHNSTFSRRGLAYFDCADDRLKPIFRELKIVCVDGHVRHAELTPLVCLDAAYFSRPVANLNDNFGQRLPRRILNDTSNRSHFDGSANRVEDVLSWRACEAFIRSGFASLDFLRGNRA